MLKILKITHTVTPIRVEEGGMRVDLLGLNHGNIWFVKYNSVGLTHVNQVG
jgi:hypothetical protein